MFSKQNCLFFFVRRLIGIKWRKTFSEFITLILTSRVTDVINFRNLTQNRPGLLKLNSDKSSEGQIGLSGVREDYNFIIFLPFTLVEEETKDGGILVETLRSISGLMVF